MALGHAEKPGQISAEIPLLQPGHTYGSITDKISQVVLNLRTPLGWFVGFGLGGILFTIFLISVG
jgi:hypothetical protein